MPLSTVLPASGLLPAAQAGGLLYREGGLHPRAYGPYRSYRPDWSYRSYRPDWSYRSYRPDWSYRQRRDC